MHYFVNCIYHCIWYQSSSFEKLCCAYLYLYLFLLSLSLAFVFIILVEDNNYLYLHLLVKILSLPLSHLFLTIPIIVLGVDQHCPLSMEITWLCHGLSVLYSRLSNKVSYGFTKLSRSGMTYIAVFFNEVISYFKPSN
ncbi:hypothetical protein V8G54_002513 [Vigna mungo]|uniref:Uncharacterized protein n=1 Tax=Vigna mungo TaxID=3915 RepID=A0AAQ3PA35_VIGMU